MVMQQRAQFIKKELKFFLIFRKNYDYIISTSAIQKTYLFSLAFNAVWATAECALWMSYAFCIFIIYYLLLIY